MTKECVEKVLDVFYEINELDLKSDISLFKSAYNDEAFRWSKGNLKHGKRMTVIFNDNRIVMFDTLKVVERLTANLKKLKHDDKKENYGCNFGIVKDLVHVINAEKLSDKEIEDFKKPIDKVKIEPIEYRRNPPDLEKQRELWKT